MHATDPTEASTARGPGTALGQARREARSRGTRALALTWTRAAWSAFPVRMTPIAVAVVLAAAVAAPGATSAVGSAGSTFAEAFDRSTLVIVATVEAAPPADAAYRLAVEEVVKGQAAGELSFPGDPTSVGLVPGSRVVVLAMDPGSLDFRGTWVLAVAPDGSIDADGLAGAPASVDDLLAVYGGGPSPAASSGPSAPSSPEGAASTTAPGAPGTSDDARPALTWAAAVAIATLAVLALLLALAAYRRRRAR